MDAKKATRFAAEAFAALMQQADGAPSFSHAKGLRSLAKKIQGSQHFILPENGILLPGWRHRPAEKLAIDHRLPFDRIVLSYSSKDTGSSGMATDLNGKKVDMHDELKVMREEITQSTRRVIVVEQYPDDSRNAVFIMPISYMDDFSTWIAMPAVLILDLESKSSEGCFVSLPGFEDVSALLPINKLAYDFADEAAATREFIAALSCANVTVSKNTLTPMLRQRENAACKKRNLPFFEHHVLEITSQSHKNERLGGSGNSPRCHLRRGHIRRLSDGRRIWVNACVVGDKKRGFVSKDYEIAVIA